MSKNKQIEPAQQKNIIEAVREHISDIEAGDVYFNSSRRNFVRVNGFQWNSYHRDVPQVVVQFFDEENGKFTGEIYRVDAFDFKQYYIRFDIPSGMTPEEAIRDIQDEAFETLKDPSKYLMMAEHLANSEDTAIIALDQKALYINAKSALEQSRRRVAIIRKLMEEKMSALNSVLSKLTDQIERVQRVIGIIELYLGVKEEIVQIQAGKPASIDTPISIRQLVLYMDEEVAVVDGGGIDWSRREEFDRWLLEKGHLNRIVPEPKCIVAMKISRQDPTDKYGIPDPFFRVQMKEHNKMTCLIIRNGENVYRIWTGISIGQRFFPTIEESEKIERVFEEASHWSFDQRDAEDARYMYMRNTFLIQGLIDRTDLFQPLPGRINFFDPATYEPGGMIQLIRDDESLLPDGRLPFREWQKQINSDIDRGSRIYVAPFNWRETHDKGSYNRRFTSYRHYTLPSPPSPGLYTVEEKIVKKAGTDKDGKSVYFTKYRILYLPDDRTANWTARKNRISFLLDESDRNVLNYDRISLDDLEYYIENRRERRDFLTILPTLIGLRRERLQELEDEKGFVALMARELDVDEKIIWDAVDWWKYKVIWKRPIRKDDALAWRMIRKKVLSKAKDLDIEA